MLDRNNSLNFKELHDRADRLINRIPTVKKKRELKSINKFFKITFLSLAIFVLLTGFLLFSQALRFKQVYEESSAGKANLEQAMAFAVKDNFSLAGGSATAAKANFYKAGERLAIIKNDVLLSRWHWAQSQLNSLNSLLSAGQFLSQAVYNGVQFGDSLENLFGGKKTISFSKFSPEEKRLILKKIYESGPELNGLKADLTLAGLSLNQVDFNGPLYFLKDKILEIKKSLNQADLILAKAVPLSEVIPVLAGYPKSAVYLVMLENNDELRPTGGFLGTYGILKTVDGEISSFDTHDIYHLDMPVEKAKIKIAPPEPLKKYLNPNWYMRDANWSPDWPTSAKKLLSFYELESGFSQTAEKVKNFDGVIALTPALITDFLKITGPIIIEGQSYNQYNFQDLLQYRVEMGYQVLGVSSWQRKEVIGLIAAELKKRIFDLPVEDWGKIVSLSIDNLEKKNLLLYFNDSRLETIVKQNDFGGEIKAVDQDYLMVVDANLAALKTDAVMKRGLDYKVTAGQNGLFSRLILSYAHNGQLDWKTDIYKSYTRVYAPLGSRLVKISGYETGQIDSGEEAGKAWFGFYLTVKPGEIKNLTIQYKLPDSVIKNNNYSFYLQKQPGKDLNQAKVDLSFLNKIKSYNPASLSMMKISPKEIKWEGDLSIDRSFEIQF